MFYSSFHQKITEFIMQKRKEDIMEKLEQNFAKLWVENKNNQLTSSEMLIYLFLTYQWKKNSYQKFTYSDYKMAKDLKLSRQTLMKAKKKLRIVELLEFSHCTGMPTVYSFPEFKPVYREKNKEGIKTVVDYKIIKDTPTKNEFVEYLKLSPNYKENLLPDILKKYDELEQEDWITQNGKISDWKKEARRIISNIMLSNFRKNQ